MPHANVNAAVRRLEDLTTELLWRQWRAVGGSATSGAPWGSIVDLEAIILASLFLGDREPRITDILYSWVELNAPLLSAQRLKNLQKLYPEAVHARVAQFVAQARALHKHPRWQTLSDVDLAAELYQEPKVPRAARIANNSAATLMLRLRAALGVGVKADALAVILGNGRPTTVAELSATLGYTAVGCRAALADLSRAGFVYSVGGRPAAFVAPEQEWQALLRLASRPVWVNWHHWFAMVIDIISWTEHANAKQLSDYAMDVGMRELAERHVMFFRLTAHELDAAAFRRQLGNYPASIEALVTWAQRQASTSH